MRMLSHFHGQHSDDRSSQPAAAQSHGHLITWARGYDLLLWGMNLLFRGKWQALRQQNIELAQLQPGERVLEVGCGTGVITLLAKARVGPTGQVYGIDPAAPMIQRARAKAARQGLPIDFQIGSIEQLAFPDHSFDVVLSSFMMHMVPDKVKRRGLTEIVRVLKPGGRLLVVDTKRPEAQADQSARMVHTGAWNSGIQDQPALMKEAGFVHLESGAIETGSTKLPEIGFVLARRA